MKNATVCVGLHQSRCLAWVCTTLFIVWVVAVNTNQFLGEAPTLGGLLENLSCCISILLLAHSSFMELLVSFLLTRLSVGRSGSQRGTLARLITSFPLTFCTRVSVIGRGTEPLSFLAADKTSFLVFFFLETLTGGIQSWPKPSLGF